MSDKSSPVTDLLKEALSQLAISLLKVELPFLSTWFMSPVLGFFAPIIIGVLFDRGAFAVDWVWISIQNHVELGKAISTKEQLQKILEAKGDYEKAEKEFDDASDALIRHNFDHISH